MPIFSSCATLSATLDEVVLVVADDDVVAALVEPLVADDVFVPPLELDEQAASSKAAAAAVPTRVTRAVGLVLMLDILTLLVWLAVRFVC